MPLNADNDTRKVVSENLVLSSFPNYVSLVLENEVRAAVQKFAKAAGISNVAAAAAIAQSHGLRIAL